MITVRCQTDPACLPTDEQVQAKEKDYYLLGSYDDGGADPLGDVFVQRLKLPMVVDSESEGTEMTLPDLASVHRWASAEFVCYEINEL